MKGRKTRETGGRNDAAEDVKKKPDNRNAPNKVASDAEELKKGGRAKRKSGGKTEMKMEGEKSKAHAGRMPRKAGGRAGSDSNPFTSARSGSDAPGRKLMKGEYSMGED